MNSLAAANQEVPKALVDLAAKDGRFRKAGRRSRGGGAGRGGRGRGRSQVPFAVSLRLQTFCAGWTDTQGG